MFKAIQQKLLDASILDEGERVLSFVQVYDYVKQQQQFKKILKEELASVLTNTKSYYLLASVKMAENDSTPIIYLLKLNEKTGDYKLKVTYNLSQIKSLRQMDERFKQQLASGKTVESEAHAFEMEFDADSMSNGGSSANSDSSFKFIWQCNSAEDRDNLLATLWKLAEQFLKANERPKFINFKLKETEVKLLSENEENAGNTEKQQQQSYEISKSDEESLLKLMSECNFVSSNAEKFVQRLQDDLVQLDTSNIESIMNSEENTLKLIDMLDKAAEEIDRIDRRLKDYEDKISAVGDAVRIVGERDNVIQLQQTNQHSLLEILDRLITSLEFPEEYRVILQESNFSAPSSIARCVNAANVLMDTLEEATDKMPSSFKYMKAYEDQRKLLELVKMRFANNTYSHLKNVISHAINKHLESHRIVENRLTELPSHRAMQNELLVYRDLLAWINRSGCVLKDATVISAGGKAITHKSYFEDLKLKYIEGAKQLYLRELGPFCACARDKVIRSEQKRNSTGSVDNLKGSVIKTGDKANEPFTVRIDSTSKETLKLVFIKLLNQVTTVVQAEQVFCQEMFSPNTQATQQHATANTPTIGSSMSRHGSSNSLQSSASTNVSRQSNDSSNKAELLVLNNIFFNNIEEQVKAVMESIVRVENMMVIFLYSDLLCRVMVSHNHKQFVHQPLVALLRFAKEKSDEYVMFLREAIKEYKPNKKEKIGIVRPVSYFEEFVKEAESCWEPIKKDMYEKLCTIYQQIVNEIYNGIENVANESQKTPPDVVRFQNYHQLNHVLRSINGLKEAVKYTRDQFLVWKQSYIKEHFGRPLENIHKFFEKVEAKIERGYKHEDISYQLDLSANNLRDIIKEYPAREVKKGLDNLYNKVQKHLVENSSLLEVVWRDMSNEFIGQYKNYEKLIKLCYAGQQIAFEFSEEDICKFFEEIAQSH